MWCVIPVAGAGTRMSGRDAGRPKSLLGVNGGTLLGRILRDVSEAVEGACLVVARGDQRFHQAVGDRFAGMPIRYAVQEARRGVGDAACAAAPCVEGPFALVMGDGYFQEPLAPYLAQWRESPCSGGLLVKEMGETTLEERDGRLVEPAGLALVEDGAVQEVAKGTDPAGYTHRVCGVTMFPAGALDACSEVEASPVTGEVESEALVRTLMARGVTFCAFRYRGWRRNVNTPDDLEEVRRRAD